MPPRRNTAVELPLAERQAMVERLLRQTRPLKKPSGRKLQAAALVGIKIPDDGTREALIAAAKKAGISLSAWVRAAMMFGLAHPEVLPLPLPDEVRKAVAERERQTRERKLAKNREYTKRKREQQRQKVERDRIAAIKRLRRQGLTGREVAAELRVHYSTVSRLEEKAGLNPPRAASRKVREAVALVAAGYSVKDAAAKAGCHVESVRVRLAANGARAK